MLRLFGGVGVGLLVVAAGCNHWRPNGDINPPPVAVSGPRPEPARGVAMTDPVSVRPPSPSGRSRSRPVSTLARPQSMTCTSP